MVALTCATRAVRARGLRPCFLGDSAPRARSREGPSDPEGQLSCPPLFFLHTSQVGPRAEIWASPLPQPEGCMQEWGLPSSTALSSFRVGVLRGAIWGPGHPSTCGAFCVRREMLLPHRVGI